ncbi:hypothetical protein BAUCODRAFT_34023 [Baudoinia panamericana UAMH 10762]|uniref:Uncharacterized protein n=1 Tax=Baudoinia panamericana (strain UAMH 10762) TaxID=717646 RepID=M2MJ01_BAUPA|nr:uncharacterized protein BAUCODRAFT_34023 [Baudoinia panamericana UAMH 10762]EMC96646.1 hypothetical protein BAUCODRAFT_34023 [Baudoinia panamericana UAMH 10762]
MHNSKADVAGRSQAGVDLTRHDDRCPRVPSGEYRKVILLDPTGQRWRVIHACCSLSLVLLVPESQPKVACVSVTERRAFAGQPSDYPCRWDTLASTWRLPHANK